ncbi:MAG: hypothetical protein R2706_06580 [Acidimicrobiales bacterium]
MAVKIVKAPVRVKAVKVLFGSVAAGESKAPGWLLYSLRMNDWCEPVAAAMNDVRAIEREHGRTRQGIEAIRDRLVELGTNTALFSPVDFPAPAEPGRSVMYRVAQDDNDDYALCVQTSSGQVASPVHNHTTWAVVVGVSGSELNRFYERADDGVTQVAEHLVCRGTGVAMLPDDLHSIELNEPSINLHCYGRALERLDERVYFSESSQQWKRYSAISGIVEARPERVGR